MDEHSFHKESIVQLLLIGRGLLCGILVSLGLLRLSWQVGAQHRVEGHAWRVNAPSPVQA